MRRGASLPRIDGHSSPLCEGTEGRRTREGGSEVCRLRTCRHDDDGPEEEAGDGQEGEEDGGVRPA